MKTIHIILNSHIDPVWLWPWQAGVDAILNTCRSVCDLLERHEDAIFTCGEAWKYWQIERTDSRLFRRIKAFVAAERWEIVGGWWIQPDCNQPSGWGMEKQIALGKKYFLDTFGQFPKIGYNVDSFGHAATLPALMREAGQDSYIMMRPGEHECTLPGRMFRWRGYDADGPQKEVVTFRIAGGYGTMSQPPFSHLQKCLYDLPDGVEDSMCFMGLGDHGGGPNETLMSWIRFYQDQMPGVRIIFSSPSRFFAAIAKQRDALPLATGELQMHAVGCYSVHRPTKVMVRKAEHLLRQAEVMGHGSDAFDAAWKQVCFHHFHDTLGGTCIPSAYAQVEAQLGGAIAAADELLHIGLRQQVVKLPEDSLGRFVVCNVSDQPFAGYVTQDIWPDFSIGRKDCRLLTYEGKVIPHQQGQSEAAVPARLMTRLLWRMELEPGETKIVRVDHSPVPVKAKRAARKAGKDALKVTPAEITSGGFGLKLGSEPGLVLAGKLFAMPYLELIGDPSDTWSHDVNRYPDGPSVAAVWENPMMADQGPLMAARMQRGEIGGSRLFAEWRIYVGEAYAELLLRVDWQGEHQILKLTWPAEMESGMQRVDGIMGGSLERELDGVERPVRDFILLKNKTAAVGVICPDIYAADATPERMRFTLLRSPLMAHHVPLQANQAPRAVFADRGEHLFRFRFMAGKKLTSDALERQAFALMRPPLVAETTAGMIPQ